MVKKKKQCSKVGAISYDRPAKYVSFTARVVFKKKIKKQTAAVRTKICVIM